MVMRTTRRHFVSWCGATLLAPTGCNPETPTTPEADAIRADGMLATPVLLVGDERTVYATVQIEARDGSGRSPGPANVALCIDTSGSMEGRAIARAQQAARALVTSMKDGDRVALVAFHTKSEVIVPSAQLDDGVREELLSGIDALEAVGTTDLSGGLGQAVSETVRNYDAQGVNRVILLGDGVPNRRDSVEPIARSAEQQGISISALGLGLQYDEVLMGKLAEITGGRYQYVDHPEKLTAFFKRELVRMNSVRARNVSVSLTAGPGVQLDHVVGAPNPPRDGTVRVPIGDLADGETRDIVVRMSVVPKKANAPVELLDALIHFNDAAQQGADHELRVYFGARASEDEGAVRAARNPKAELKAALAEAGATTLSALELANAQRYGEARDALRRGAAAALSQAKRTPSKELEAQASKMLNVATDFPADDTGVSRDRKSAPAERRRKALHRDSYLHSH